MKKSYLTLIVFFSFFLQFRNAIASHESGGDLTYKCIGPNQYEITLKVFRDCSGVTMGTLETVTITNTCGLVNPALQLNLINPLTNLNCASGIAEDCSSEISQLCPTQLPNSTCSGGALPGMQLYLYRGIVTLPGTCDSWSFDYSLCCRNTSVNLAGSTGLDFHVTATMNSDEAPCNNSPIFTAQPVPYVCANQVVNYNMGVVETDADSLVYSFVAALTAGGVQAGYNAGYSGALPLPGITINSSTGQMSFTPVTIGNFTVVVQVDEYRNGRLIGTTMRDIQYVVQACTNTVPAVTGGIISNLTGTAVQTSDYTIEMCEGDFFTFTATFSDPDAVDDLTLTSNVLTVLNGATFTQSGTNPRTATITWTALAGTANTNTVFYITVQDDACPVPGVQTMIYDINVLQRTMAGPDRYYCPIGGPEQLAVTGGTSFTWTPATGLSCTNCATPTAAPPATTTYIVTSNLSSGCINSDTITVFVVPNFSVSSIPTNATICKYGSVQLAINADVTYAPYTYSWTPTTGLSCTNCPNPIASPLVTTVYTANVTSSTGCNQIQTFTINVVGVAPKVVVSAVDSTICLGTPTQLSATIYADVCATTGIACSGAAQTITLGAGTFATSSYTPFYQSASPYGYSTRMQYLFTKAELDALGFVGGGKITSIALNIQTAGTAATGLVIKMGCTGMDQFPNGNHLTGLTTVKTSFNHNPAVGWNTFNLTTPYMWDGQSSLVVEMCADAEQTGTSSTAMYTSTGALYKCIYDNIYDLSGACSDPTGWRTTIRPDMQFTFCKAVPASFTYTWTPATGLSATNIINPTANPAVPTVYQLSVSDGSCVGADNIQINVAPNFNLTMSPNATICMNNSTGISATPSLAGTYTYSWSPTPPLSNIYVANPIASPLVTTTFTVVSTSAAGCKKTGTTRITVSGVAPKTLATAVEDTICLGVPSQLSTLVYPAACGTTTNACTGSSNTITVGTGTFSTPTYGPYYLYSTTYSNRKQYLFRKAELDAMGFVGGGKITSIGLNLITIGTAVSGMTISMGCTSLNAFPDGNYVTGLSLVKSSFNHTPVAGWNTYSFTSPYYWDGVSNLIVEFCVDNAQTGTATYVYYGTYAFNAMIYNYPSTNGACSQTGYVTTARPNMQFTFCQAVPATYTYAWTPATGLSATNINNPTANPGSTTTYTVAVSDGGACLGYAPVTVTVAPNFNLTMSPNTTICMNNSTVLNTTPSIAGSYTYAWSPTAPLSNYTLASPIATPLTTTTFTVTATSAAGCKKTGTTRITVSGVAPITVASASPATTCLGTPTQLNTLVYPPSCGISATACSGAAQTITVGTSSSSTTTYSPAYLTTAPYGYSNRKQFLFRKAELDAMGFAGGGKITSLALQYTTAGTSVNNVVIKMGCTSLTEFPDGNHATGLATVKTAFTMAPTIGWNTYALTNAFMWDGFSNLIVEFCVDLKQSGTTSSISYGLPGFYAMIYDNIYELDGACSDPTGFRTTARPLMQFTFCPAIPASYIYTWTPGTGLSASNIKNPTANPASTTTYTVSVNDGGSCLGYSYVTVNVAPSFTLNMSPTANICMNSSTSIVGIPSVLGTYTYSWTPTTDLSDPTIFDPIASPLVNTTYTLSATSSLGCTVSNTVRVNISGISPVVAPTASDSVVCPGFSNPMDVVVYPGICATTTQACTGAAKTATLGTMYSWTSTYSPLYLIASPSVYSNRKQFIFRKSELDAMGLAGGGKITSVALNFYAPVGTSATGVVIKMGCTSLNEYPDGNHIAGLTTVKTSFTINPAAGWNTFALTNAYMWDGQSNLVVEFCVDAAQSGTTTSVYYSLPGFYAMIYDNISGLSGACSDPTGFRTTARPDMQFTMCPSVAPGFTYAWSPPTSLSSTSIKTPTSTAALSQVYTVTVTDPSGCQGSGSVAVNMDGTNGVVATPTPDPTVCPGTSIQLGATVSGTPSVATLPSCGVNGTACTQALVQRIAGTGTTGSTASSPFTQLYNDAKYQYLFRASDLLAAGFTPGTIRELAFNVTVKSSTYNYTAFTLGIGCTNQTNLSTTTGWLPVTTVWGAAAHASTAGWNNFVLTTPYDWDGIQNIVIQVCYNQANNRASASDACQYTLGLGFTAAMSNYTTGAGNGCNHTPSFVSTNRPNVRFTMCPPPPNAFTYSWSPPASVSNATIANPTATALAAINYVVTVSGGKCVVRDTVKVAMCNVSLPNELISFTGENYGEDNLLKWFVSPDCRAENFVLERSQDGKTFVELTTLNAREFKAGTQEYKYIDTDPGEGKNLYRLKLMRLGANDTYSDVVKLENKQKQLDLMIYPNPFTNTVNIEFNLLKENNVKIEMFDLLGRVVLSKERSMSQGNNTLMYDVSELQQGVYTIKLQIKDLEITEVRKLVK